MRRVWETIALPAQSPSETAGRSTGKAQQVRHFLVELIGASEPHARMPTERELAEKFDTTRLTIRRVLDQLDNEGRVYRTQGAGTFVSEPRISKSVELTSFSADMRARGLLPGSLDTRVEVVAAGARVGAALHISPRDSVIHITRTRTADAVPMALEHCYMPLALVPGLENRDWNGSLYEILWSEYGLQAEKAEQTIQASVLDEADAKALSVPPFSPAFVVQRVTMDARGRRMEYALSTYRADRYSYDMVIYRRTGNN